VKPPDDFIKLDFIGKSDAGKIISTRVVAQRMRDKYAV